MRISRLLTMAAILFLHGSAQAQDSLPPIVPGENWLEHQTSEDLAPIRSAVIHRLMETPAQATLAAEDQSKKLAKEAVALPVEGLPDNAKKLGDSQGKALPKSNPASRNANSRKTIPNRAAGPAPGLRKDLTISMDGRSELVERESKPTTKENRRKYGNKRTAKLPFEKEVPRSTGPQLIKDKTTFPKSPSIDESFEEKNEVPSPKVKTVSANESILPAKESILPAKDELDSKVESKTKTTPAVQKAHEPSGNSVKVQSAEHVVRSAGIKPSVVKTTGVQIGLGLISGDGTCPPDIEYWRPHGYDGVWPADEYLCDGGDANVRATVNRDSVVYGLDLEDTIAHYDTADGRTLVAPSNSVCIYAPRFASVRKLVGVQQDERLLRPGEIDLPVPPLVEEATRPPMVVEQPLPTLRLLDIDGPLALRDRRREVEIDQTQRVAELVREFEAYEDFQVVRLGVDSSAEKARLIEYIVAAVEWSDNDAPEVLVGGQEAAVNKSVERTGLVYQVEVGSPCLRIIKLADRTAAQPGEIVEFTLRYDNIGEQTVDQVTIMDNLTTRLEYVPNSSQSDREAEFLSEENQGESLALRWEIKEPLLPGDGGIIRFRCRVR